MTGSEKEELGEWKWSATRRRKKYIQKRKIKQKKSEIKRKSEWKHEVTVRWKVSTRKKRRCCDGDGDRNSDN
jgi:hypothetical protein